MPCERGRQLLLLLRAESALAELPILDGAFDLRGAFEFPLIVTLPASSVSKAHSTSSPFTEPTTLASPNRPE